MRITFTKMHGAGNDFILVDNRKSDFPITDTPWLQRIAARHTGIGCDGIILIEPASNTADFRMRFINPDGNEVDMCGNGARCLARFAYDLKIAESSMIFQTRAGNVHADILADGRVAIGLSPVSTWEHDVAVDTTHGTLHGEWINTGVPHAVFKVDNVDEFDVVAVGRDVRYAQPFQPKGTNADFFHVMDNGTLKVRTYERGVEDETLACGTGLAATALCAVHMGLAVSPVRLLCRNGDLLDVNFNINDVSSVTLTGPAAYVFEGTCSY